MKSLVRSAKHVQEEGGRFLEPLFRPLEEARIKIRMGTATFIAGPPGAMKTGLALYWVLRLNVPTLYVSADAEDFEIVERAAAAITGDRIETVRANPSAYAEALGAAHRVRFVYGGSVGYDDLKLEIMAFTEVFGAPPEVVVIDNIMNLIPEQENEWGAHRDHMRVINEVAKRTGAAVLALAHMADDREDTSVPAARKKLLGKISQLPKAIFSLAIAGDELRVAQVKSKWGPEYPSGKVYTTLYVDASRNRIFNSRYDMQTGVPA